MARRIEVPVNRVAEFLGGRSAVAYDETLRFGRFFEMPGEFRLNLQKFRELHFTEPKNGAETARLPSPEDDNQLRDAG